MKSLNAILAALLITVTVAPAFAGEPQQQGRTRDLRTAARQLASRSQDTKGAPRQLMLLESKRIEKLADKIQAGQHVDPAEIDRAIDRAEHGSVF